MTAVAGSGDGDRPEVCFDGIDDACFQR